MNIRLQIRNRLGSGENSVKVITSQKCLLDAVDKQISDIKEAIQQHINADEELRKQQDLLISIPGIGKLTAAKLLAEIQELSKFDSAAQLAAYSGLTPCNVLSGTSIHKKSRMSKTGISNLRKALYMPAISAKRFNPIVRDFCLRLQSYGLRPMELIGAAMHKLIKLAYGILKSGKPFDPCFLSKLPV